MVLTIANQKGGVAKTTTAASVAWLLAEEHGCRVALLDLDAQGSLTAALLPERPRHTLADWLLDSRPLPDAVTPLSENLALLAGSTELATAGAALLREDAYVLRDALRGERERFDTWVLDTPPELGPLTVAALCASTEVLVPVQVYAQAVRGLVQLLATVDRVRGLAATPRVIGILPTFLQARPRHHREVLEALAQTYPDLLLPPIPQSVVVQYADVAHRPVVAQYPNHPVSQAYREAARLLLQRAGG